MDVLGLQAEASQLRAVARSPEALGEHWRSPQGQGPWPMPVVAQLERCCSEKPIAMEMRAVHFNASCAYVSVRCRGRWLAPSRFGLAADVLVAGFEVQWANPLWDVLGIEPESEGQRILGIVKELLQDMQPRPEQELDVSDSSFIRILPEDLGGVRMSRLQSALLAASQFLGALDSMGPAPWVSLAAVCLACVGLRVGPSLAARRPATAAHGEEAAGGEDEDQWAVVTDAGQLGPSIRATDDTMASSPGGVSGRSEDRM